MAVIDEEVNEEFAQTLEHAFKRSRVADPTAALMDGTPWNHLLVRPTESTFAQWLLSEGLAFTTDAGDVILPYAGGQIQAAVLAHTLKARIRELESMQVTRGKEPPAPYFERLEQDRRRLLSPF